MSKGYRIAYRKAGGVTEDNPQGYPKGAEFDVDSLSDAERYHPDAVVTHEIADDGALHAYKVAAKADAPKEEPKPVAAPKVTDEPVKAEAKK